MSRGRSSRGASSSDALRAERRRASPRKNLGRILDSQSGTPLPGAFVELIGTTLKSTSSVDGRYTLLGVPKGSATLRIRLIGYQPKTVVGIEVAEGTAVAQDVALAPAEAIEFEGIVVSAAVERDSVVQTLDARRNATCVINAITSEQIERSPDRDAGQAVQRVSGVTIQDDKYVFVRGARSAARVPASRSRTRRSST